MNKYIVINLAPFFFHPPSSSYNEFLYDSRNFMWNLIEKHKVLLDLIISINPVSSYLLFISDHLCWYRLLNVYIRSVEVYMVILVMKIDHDYYSKVKTSAVCLVLPGSHYFTQAAWLQGDEYIKSG